MTPTRVRRTQRGDGSCTDAPLADPWSLAGRKPRTAELDRALPDLVERLRTPDGVVAWEYLLIAAAEA